MPDPLGARKQVATASPPFDPRCVEAIAFDYGNTLVPFGPREVEQMNDALSAVLERAYGSVDRPALDRIRAADRLQPYRNGFRENDIPELCRHLVREMYGDDPHGDVVAALVAARFRSFVDVIRLPTGTEALLRRLTSRYKIGLLSNYPDGHAVRTSLSRLGILESFDAVVVSGDIGWCKPDRRPFAALADGLGAAPGASLYVGDNWLADVQGAKRFGMAAAWITDAIPIEHFEPEPGDVAPDLTVATVADLESVLTR